LPCDSCLTSLLIVYLLGPLPPRSTRFPYTTLFRSEPGHHRLAASETQGRQDLLPAGGDAVCVAHLNRPNCGEREDLSLRHQPVEDRKSTRLNSSHVKISYAVFCLKKKKTEIKNAKL